MNTAYGISRFFRAVVLILVCCPLGEACEGSNYRIWIPRHLSADALYRFTRGRKAGYIDRSGKIAIPPRFSYLDERSGPAFHDGLLLVGVSNGIYVDQTGRTVIDKGLYRGRDFSEGLAVAMRKRSNKWGYINTRGDFVIGPRFDSSDNSYVWSSEGGFAKIEIKGRYGYISHTGKFAIQPRYLEAEGFHDGMARVVAEGPCAYMDEGPCPSVKVIPPGAAAEPLLHACKYTFIDGTGRIVTDRRFEGAGDFSSGVAPVLIGSRWGYLNKVGEIIIRPQFSTAASFSDGLALVSENGQFGYIDRNGDYVIRPSYMYAESFAEDRAVVGEPESSSYWYIDRSGRQAIPGQFALASPFFKGLAHVKLVTGDPDVKAPRRGVAYAYIDRAGRRVFTYVP